VPAGLKPARWYVRAAPIVGAAGRDDEDEQPVASSTTEPARRRPRIRKRIVARPGRPYPEPRADGDLVRLPVRSRRPDRDADRRRRGPARRAAHARPSLRDLGPTALRHPACRLLDAPRRSGARLRRRPAPAWTPRRDPAQPARGDRPRAGPFRPAASLVPLPEHVVAASVS